MSGGGGACGGGECTASAQRESVCSGVRRRGAASAPEHVLRDARQLSRLPPMGNNADARPRIAHPALDVDLHAWRHHALWGPTAQSEKKHSVQSTCLNIYASLPPRPRHTEMRRWDAKRVSSSYRSGIIRSLCEDGAHPSMLHAGAAVDVLLIR